ELPTGIVTAVQVKATLCPPPACGSATTFADSFVSLGLAEVAPATRPRIKTLRSNRFMVPPLLFCLYQSPSQQTCFLPGPASSVAAKWNLAVSGHQACRSCPSCGFRRSTSRRLVLPVLFVLSRDRAQ